MGILRCGARDGGPKQALLSLMRWWGDDCLASSVPSRAYMRMSMQVRGPPQAPRVAASGIIVTEEQEDDA